MKSSEAIQSGSVEERLEETFRAAECRGFAHAIEIDGRADVGVGSDHLVVLASSFKIPVALELGRQVASGDVELTERVRVTAEDRVLGPTGLSGFAHDAEVSIRDLSYLMITVSDNTATDLVIRRIGLESVNATLRTLGLTETVLVGDCRMILQTLLDDLGLTPDQSASISTLDPELVRASRSVTAEETSRSTPREMAQLVRMIWRDEAGPAEACELVRSLMGAQIWRDRLLSGFPDEVRVAGKTGSLPGVRNEVGAVEYPDGQRHAVAIFTVAESLALRLPAIDHAIGEAARIAVEALRPR